MDLPIRYFVNKIFVNNILEAWFNQPSVSSQHTLFYSSYCAKLHLHTKSRIRTPY